MEHLIASLKLQMWQLEEKLLSIFTTTIIKEIRRSDCEALRRKPAL